MGINWPAARIEKEKLGIDQGVGAQNCGGREQGRIGNINGENIDVRRAEKRTENII